MARVIRLLLTLALAGALAGSPAWAQAIRINPVPPNVKPQWTPIPGVPKAFYAPNLPTDIFRYQGKYYFFWAGYLYQGKKPSGPWQTVKEAPAFFSQIDPAYFKTAAKAGAAPPEIGAPPAGAVPGQPEQAPETAAPWAPSPPEPGQGAPALPEAAPEGAPKPPRVM
jgi:hypothetical protein